MAAAADFEDVRELALRVDLAHASAGVDEIDLSLGVDDDAGSRVSRGSGSEQPGQGRNSQDRSDPRTAHEGTPSRGRREWMELRARARPAGWPAGSRLDSNEPGAMSRCG